MNLASAMCEAIVDGWVADRNMGYAVHRAWLLTSDKKPEDDKEAHECEKKALRVKHIAYGGTVKNWVHANAPRLSDAMWAGRPRDTCLSVAQSSILGKSKLKTATHIVRVRSRDKRSDWNTVK